jgi:hypothetical protein
MSHSKNYDNNKNNIQSKTNPVENLNEILSVENASAEKYYQEWIRHQYKK